MDNLSSNKVESIIDPIIAVGAEVRYLPQYNPIELMWSKIKAYLRKLKARTKEALELALVEAIDSISLTDV